ncbi:MAG: hypothetical protein ACOH1V_02295 [Stenotrophomonas sp.]
MKDHSYLGSGKLLVREYGANAAFIEVGNCSALTFSPQTNRITLADHTQPGGGERNAVERLTSVEMAYTFHDFASENFARALRGNTVAVTAGTVTDEEVVAHKGGFIPLSKIASSITTVKGATGATTYVAGTDYVFQDGGLFIPDTSAIPASVGGAANVKVTYANVAQTRVEALINSAKQYEILFLGLNEAQSGKAVRVRAHKVSGGLMQQLGLIGEDYGQGEVTGTLQSDTTKGAGLSKYFTWEMEDVA